MRWVQIANGKVPSLSSCLVSLELILYNTKKRSNCDDREVYWYTNADDR